MKNEVLSGLNPNIQNNDKFQHGKGYFYIDDDAIMTKNQILTIMV